MAKDPAFLFYPADFMGGTQTFTREEKGAYIDLLCLQFNQGPMTIESVRRCLGSDFDRLWPFLQSKFQTDAQGNFFQKRLATEIEKRQKYSESRRNNRKGTHEKDMSNISESYVQHMENENRNVIVIDNEVKERGVGETIETVLDRILGNEILIGNLRHLNGSIDFDAELAQFRTKVLANPDHYEPATDKHIRHALSYHMRNAKKTATLKVKQVRDVSLADLGLGSTISTTDVQRQG